jgi:NAD-dependent SIR2 family protein deacetylase
VVLSGAGLSTESGIPDYRGTETRRRARQPIQYREFIGSEQTRRRYWARSMIGWPKMRAALPNAGHRAVAELQAAGIVTGIITQNVDRLHTRAGSTNVIELHGALQEVTCLTCHRLIDRDALQSVLVARNADHVVDAELQPDGDAERDPEGLETFFVPTCEHCGGVLKPHVVYFGENVPRERVERAYAMQDEADVLLVLGSSLTVFSGYRFVLRAAEYAMPVAIVNLDETRGDVHASIRVKQPLGEALVRLATAFTR